MRGRTSADVLRKPCSLLLCSVLVVLSACTSSQRAASPDAEQAVEQTASGPIPGPFWELKTSADSPPRMYLLGSVHAASKDMFPLAPAIEQAYERSAGLVVEINLLAVDPEEMQRLLATHGLLLGEETLADMLPPETLDGLSPVLERRNMTLQNVERMRPWLVATILQEAQLAELGYEFTNGIDLHFLQRAADDKTVVSLETLESQLQMLSTLPPEVELRFLQDMLGEPDELRDKTKTLMQAWQRGDEATLARIIFEHSDDPELAELYERLIFRRNTSMANEIERLLEEPGPWFVVVGAGHFVGDRSVIAHLKRSGYDIRRVR